MTEAVKNFIAEWESGAPFMEAHTSGSTGTPKRILLPRRLVEESALRSVRHFGLDRTSRVHVCLSPEYIAGKMAVIRALLSGAALTAEEPSSEPRIGMEGGEVTLLSVVAAQVPSLAERAANGKIPHIRHLLVGGAPLTENIAEAALQAADNVWESYGMTETASHIALRRIERTEDVRNKPFTLLPGIRVSTDERGCLAISLPGEEETLITNDVIQLCSTDSFMVLGRRDNVIITGGLKVHPEQVEKRLAPLLSHFSAYFITPRPHPKWGASVVLVVEAPDGLSAPERDRLLEASAKLLPRHERPREIVALSSLPRTTSGKIIRRL